MPGSLEALPRDTIDGIDLILQLLRDCWLVPIEVFGDEELDRVGYGLMDRNGVWSDCNRAERFMLRPADTAMNDPRLRPLIEQIDEGEVRQPWRFE